MDAIASAVPHRYRALILVAAFGGLRWGELAGLRRRRIDLATGTVVVAEQLLEVAGTFSSGPLKSRAGHRAVVLPAAIVPVLADHLTRYVRPDPDAFVFLGERGGHLRRSNFNRRIWATAVTAAGVPDPRFHDLRHTAGTLATAAGATLREVMTRLGTQPSPPRCATSTSWTVGTRRSPTRSTGCCVATVARMLHGTSWIYLAGKSGMLADQRREGCGAEGI